MADQNILKAKQFLTQYSLNDLARSFFVLDLWLPNISARIKIQYLYTLLEAICDQLPEENKIESYDHFKYFCHELFKILPSFVMLEDYIPEPDWGDVKYYFEKSFFQIFYGGDLSNPYDFYYSFEITHKTFKNEYMDILKRSPIGEMRFCLEVQDDLLKNISQEKSEVSGGISPGDISLPSESFWNNTRDYINKFDPKNRYSPDKLSLYTKELSEPTPFTDLGDFISKAYEGRNCKYFFIKKNDKYYPAIPRKYLTVLYDTWGELFKNNYTKILEKIGDKDLGVLIGIQLYNFLKSRVKEENIFPLASPVDGKLKPHELIFTAIHAEDKLFLIHVTPPVFDFEKLQSYIDGLKEKLKEVYDLATKVPTRLGLRSQQRIVEFRSLTKNKGLEPVFLFVLPPILTSIMGGIKPIEDIPSEVISLDQIAGIFDEIKSPKELVDFFDHINTEREFSRISPLNSYLDRFGSFKDSYGVLVPGANEPDRIMLDFNWGSNYRFRTLKDFWKTFPEENIYGHPRSWDIPADYITKTGCILSSKTFFGYAYHQKIGEAIFFINAPVHLMDLKIGKIIDSFMYSLFDSIDKYSNILNKLDLTKAHKKIQVFFCSSSLAENHKDLKHVKHLVQDKELWSMDVARIKINDYGVKIVYNDEMLIQVLEAIEDRSIQISLLVDVLKKITEIIKDEKIDEVIKELNKERSKKPRFKMFRERKKASFPEGIKTIYPEINHFKLADKKIAVIAKSLEVKPGDYSNNVAKENLNLLRDSIVEVIDEKVKEYNFSASMPYLIEKADAIISDSEHKEAQIKASLSREVDYERGLKHSEDHANFLHWYKDYRYLLEKFVCLQPSGDKILNEESLKELLALVDRIFDVYTASDFIHYDLYPVKIKIDRDYLVSVIYEVDMPGMEKAYGEEQAKLDLGEIGNKEDTADFSIPVEKYLDDLDIAFKNDFGFGLKNFINVQQVLALWADHSQIEDRTYYSATSDEILLLCSKIISGYDNSETNAILDFLTLKPEKMLLIKNDVDEDGVPNIAKDLPVWEYNKRLDRHSIRPIIKIDGKYCWGAYTIERVSHVWMSISRKHRLPADFDTSKVNKILNDGHKNLEENLVNKIKEIALRHTQKVETNVYPHKRDNKVSDIGDVDVLAYLKEKNILLNIESKIIDPPYCHKDSARMQRKIFVDETREDGSIRKSYVKRVEKRADFLKKNGKSMMDKIGWKDGRKDFNVVSVFVTKMGFWWTKHPPIKTEVNFVETRLLDDFIKNLSFKSFRINKIKKT